MSDEEYYENLWSEMMNRLCDRIKKLVIFCAVIISVSIICCSCATKERIVYRDVNKYITNTVHDTLREKSTDSVYLEVIQKGDTVYKTKYKQVTKWRDRIVEVHDTCFKDSIVTEKETVEVVKYPKSYWYSVGISLIFFIFAFVKLMLWFQKKLP